MSVVLPKLNYAQQGAVKYRHIWTNQTFAPGAKAEVEAAFGHIPACIVAGEGQDSDEQVWTELHSFVQDSFSMENQLDLTSILAN